MKKLMIDCTLRLKRRNDQFVFIDINQAFLQELKLQEYDVIGRSLYEFKDIVGDYYDDMNKNYERAWQGQSVFYYVVSDSNPKTFFVISLYPISDENGTVSRVDGHCVPLDNDKLLQSGLSLFNEHEPISILEE